MGNSVNQLLFHLVWQLHFDPLGTTGPLGSFVLLNSFSLLYNFLGPAASLGLATLLC